MLQDIRDKAQGWIAWAIVILISIPFALWGIQEYLGIGSEPVVASVNGSEITERALDQRYHNFRQDMREQLGAAYRPELFDDERMKQEVLKRMVREDVIMQSSHDLGLRAGDTLVRQAILGLDTFKKDGRFDQEVYERSVRMQGLTTAGFEQRVRRALLQNQLSAAIQGGAFVTDHELEQAVRLGKQSRDVAYFVLPTKDFSSEEEIPEADIAAYYEQNKERYRSPEQVKVEFILLDGNSVGKTIAVTDELLQTHYNGTQDKYGVDEQRQASHILITLAEDADEASVDEAMSRLNELRASAEAGEDFAELAKAHSQDPGSAAEGGDLGFFGRGVMDPAFEEAVFALEEGAISEPVLSSFGLHLIKLTAVTPSSIKPFEEVRGEVERDYRKAEAEKQYDELAVRLADLSYEDPASLLPASEAINIPVATSDWFDRNGGVGVLRHPKVVAAAFSDDVLHGHNNSELIEIEQGQSLVLRVVDHRESSFQPLADVSHKIVKAIANEQAAEKTKTEAESRLVRLQAGEELAQVAGDYEVAQKEAVERGDKATPAALLQEVFRAARPEAGGAVSGLARLSNGNYAIYSLTAVKDGSLEGLDEPARKAALQGLRREIGRTQFDHLVADLEQRADITYLKTPDSK